MKQHIIKSIMIFLLGILLIIGCDSNNGTGTETPESATISGTITFTGTWPSDGDVTVSLSTPWPPNGPPSDYDLITEEALTNNTYTYTFEDITFGTYGGISVAWEDPDPTLNDSNNKNFLGASSGTYPFMGTYGAGVDPTPITVSSTEYALTGVDITANLSYAVSSGGH